MEEEWRTLIYQGDVYENFEISNTGKLKNINTGTVYRQTIGKTGYYGVCVSLGSRKKKKLFKIHKCVAETFIPNLDNKETINHIDGNKLNNNVSNLEWATYSENTQHAETHGLISHLKGENNPNSKLTQEQVEWIRNNYIPWDKEYGSRAIGRKFKIEHSSILDIIKYKRYM